MRGQTIKNIFVVARTLRDFQFMVEDRFGEENVIRSENAHVFSHGGMRYIYATARGVRGMIVDGVRFVKPSPHDISELCSELRHRMGVSSEEFYSVKNNWYYSGSPEGKIALLGELGT